MVIILSPKYLAGSQMVLVYKRQRMTTEVNSIQTENCSTKLPSFLHYGLDLICATHSYLRNNDKRETETATSPNHQSDTCLFLTSVCLADYKDTANGVILTQQREGERKRAHRCQVRVQGFPASPRPTCPG